MSCSWAAGPRSAHPTLRLTIDSTRFARYDIKSSTHTDTHTHTKQTCCLLLTVCWCVSSQLQLIKTGLRQVNKKTKNACKFTFWEAFTEGSLHVTTPFKNMAFLNSFTSACLPLYKHSCVSVFLLHEARCVDEKRKEHLIAFNHPWGTVVFLRSLIDTFFYQYQRHIVLRGLFSANHWSSHKRCQNAR